MPQDKFKRRPKLWMRLVMWKKAKTISKHIKKTKTICRVDRMWKTGPLSAAASGKNVRKPWESNLRDGRAGS